MVNSIIRFSVKNKGMVLFFTLLTMIYGLYSLVHLPIDAIPDITNNQIQINTEVKGWSAEEIEKTVTFPVEANVRGIPNIKNVRSLSRFGLSQVTVIFEDDMDIYLARQLVSERLQNVEGLPEGASPQLGPISTGLGEIFQYKIDFKNVEKNPQERFKQLVELKTIQDWNIKPRLLGVKGVAEINTTGGFERQIHLLPNPDKLSRYGLEIEDISSALAGSTQNVGGGYVEQDAEQFIVQGIGFLKSPQEILEMPVKVLPNYDVITISDVADVIEGKETRTGSATFNGDEIVLGTVMMMTGENSRTTAQNIAERVEEIKKDLPDDLELTVLYSRSDLVNATIGTVWHNIATGACLVIIILFLLVGNIRAAFITALAIPLSLLITVICMRLFNISGNLMSLGALDFGIIIDGVVIVVDHCMRKLKEKVNGQENLTHNDIDEIVISATAEIRKAAGFGQLILVVVFLPIFALVGIEAKTFQPMASTFIFALLGAMVLSFTLTPALVALLLRSGSAEKESKIMLFLERRYSAILFFLLKKTKAVIAFALAIIVVGIFLFKSLGGEFMPQLKEGAFAFHVIKPQNVSLTMSLDLQEKVEKLISEHPQVDHVFSRIGTSEIATDPMGMNIADTYIILKDFGKGMDLDAFSHELTEELKENYPGMQFLASQPIQMRFNELLEGSRSDLTIKIFGDDLEILAKIGKEVEEAIKPVSEQADVELEQLGAFPVLAVEPKLFALKKYGVNKNEVLQLMSMALAGEEVGYYYDKDKRYPIIVRLEESLRGNIDVIKKLPVATLNGNIVPLEELADIRFKETYGAINREDGNRRSAIMVNIRGIDTETFVKKAQAIVEEKVTLPNGYYIEWGGQYENMQKAMSRLSILTVVTLGVMFFMIYAAFHSVKQTFLIFFGIPFALFGGVLSLIISGIPFSISAGVGFIALLGIAVLNGIVLINGFAKNSYNNHGLKARVLQGAKMRLRPVLMTALTDVLGFLPMALATGVGAEVQKPLAVVIIGGIISSTILTLAVLPTLYYRVYKK
ncbi:MAG: efflux RND transporter permease subunit [Alphaproteobacteria bacterium]